MVNAMNLELFINQDVKYKKNRGSDEFYDYLINSIDYDSKENKIWIHIRSLDSEKELTLDARVVMDNDKLLFFDEDLQLKMKNILQEMKCSVEEQPVKPTRSYRSKNDVTNALTLKILNHESITLDLVELYDDNEYELNLLEETFPLLERVMNGHELDDYWKASIVVALSFIALKYYDRDFYSHVIEKYRAIRMDTAEKYEDNRIQKSIRTVLDEFRDSVHYFNPRSHCAVPIVNCCCPHYRVADLFKLSFGIYKNKLLYDEDITDDQIMKGVEESLKSLRNKDLIQETDKIAGTEYLMSKYTQSCIYSGVNFTALVELITNCIRLIIKSLTLQQDAFVVVPFYQDGLNNWLKDFESNDIEQERYRKTRTASRPTFQYTGGRIYIVTGEIIMDDSYDPEDVSIIVYSKGEKHRTIKISDPNAIERTYESDPLSGYRIHKQQIAIDCNPLDDIGYSIVVSGVEIHSSKERLYRKVLFFDGKGKEIKPGTDYSSELYVVSRTDNIDEYDNIQTVVNTGDYYISRLRVNNRDVFLFDDDPYVFYNFTGAKFLGYCLHRFEFDSKILKKKFPIYSTANLLFSSPCEKENVIIELDGKSYDYNDLVDGEVNFTIKVYSNGLDKRQVLLLKLGRMTSGFHKISLRNNNTNRIIEGTKMSFIIDSKMKCEYFDKTNHSVWYDIYSSFFVEESETIDFAFSKDKYIINDIFVPELGHGNLIVYPSTISYSVDGEIWEEVTKYLKLFELADSVDRVLVHGPRDLIAEYSSRDNKCVDLKRDESISTSYSFSLAYLRSLGSNKTETITFKYGSKCRYLKVQYYPYVTDDSEFGYDPDKGVYSFRIAFDGNTQVLVKISDSNSGVELVEREIVSNEVIELSRDDIPAETSAVLVSLFGKKTTGFFSKYTSDAYYEFPPYRIVRKKLNYINHVLEFNSVSNRLVASYAFSGADRARMALVTTVSGIDESWKRKVLCVYEVQSGERIEFDISSYPFNRYTCCLYPLDGEIDEVKPVHSERIEIPSSLLAQRFKIRYFYDDIGNKYNSDYSLYFAKFLEHASKIYYVCKLFKGNREANDGVGIDNVLLHFENESTNEYKLSMRFLSDGHVFTRLRLHNGKVVEGVILMKKGGTYGKSN